MKRDVFDIALELLDHEVVDADGVPCGIVDDVELAGEPGEPLRAVALTALSGRSTCSCGGSSDARACTFPGATCGQSTSALRCDAARSRTGLAMPTAGARA